MAHTRVSINRNWYGKIPIDKNGNAIPKNLWPKRRNFSWEVRWYDSEGKRLSKSFKDRKDAYEYAKTVQEKVDKGRADKPRKITLADFIKEHSKVMVGQVGYATLVEHIRALKFFSKHIGESIELEKISPRLAESFVSERLSGNLSPATVNKDIRTLKTIFNLAIEPRGYIAEGTNPFKKIKQRKIAKKSVRYISVEEFSKVLEVSSNLWWKTFLTVAYTSGGRKNELLNLTWADIDFEKNNISFVPKKATENLLMWEPKDHESRTVPVPEKVIQLLANLQSQTDESSPYVFINSLRLKCILDRRSHGRWNTKSEVMNNVLDRFKVLCKRAGVKEFCLHDLRRSCITNWAKRLPIHVVQELAGHSDMETTREFYLSIEKSDRDLAREIQEDVLTKLTNF